MKKNGLHVYIRFWLNGDFCFCANEHFKSGEKNKAGKQILSDFSVHEAENLRKFGNSYKI